MIVFCEIAKQPEEVQNMSQEQFEMSGSLIEEILSSLFYLIFSCEM